jgi:hypothetical protein
MNLLFASSDPSGCGFYRSQLPALFLGKYYEVMHFDGTQAEIPLKDDTVTMLQRAISPLFEKFIDIAKIKGQKVIYDLDDNLWEVGFHNPAKAAYTPEVLRLLEHILSKVDAVTVSTEPLKRYVSRFHNNIHIIPNFIPFSPPPEKARSWVRIGWAGSNTHANDFDVQLFKALQRLHDEEAIDVVFFGWRPPLLSHTAAYVPFVPSSEFYAKLQELNFTIGLIPCAPTIFNASKSNVKYLEYSMLGAVSVASDVVTYNTTIKHGINGMLVSKPKHWYPVLKELCGSPELRKTLADNAHAFVRDNYTFEHNADLLLEKYRALFRSIGAEI